MTTNQQLQFIPTPTEGGGTTVGNSYVTLFDRCPRKWFNETYRPLLDDSGEVASRGLQPILKPLPLLTGGLFHEAIATLYLTGCRDGEDTGQWNLGLALDTLGVQWAKAKSQGEYESDEAALNDRTGIELLVRNYCDRFGPGSPNPDWPDIRVLHDEKGEPLIEREFRLRLNADYVFTSRLDLIVTHRGFLKAIEHKTRHYRFVKQYLNNLKFDAQLTSEFYVLKTQLPELPLNGVMANVLVKERSMKSQFDIAERETTNRTQAQLDRWRAQTLNTLGRIDHAVGEFERAVGEGVDVERAADLWFPTLGTRTDTCFSFNRDCDFARLCLLPGMESRTMDQFRPRSFVETTTLRERS